MVGAVAVEDASVVAVDLSGPAAAEATAPGTYSTSAAGERKRRAVARSRRRSRGGGEGAPAAPLRLCTPSAGPDSRTRYCSPEGRTTTPARSLLLASQRISGSRCPRFSATAARPALASRSSAKWPPSIADGRKGDIFGVFLLDTTLTPDSRKGTYSLGLHSPHTRQHRPTPSSQPEAHNCSPSRDMSCSAGAPPAPSPPPLSPGESGGSNLVAAGVFLVLLSVS